ncbi:MAG: PAS domain S-box protein [Woeseiaceae bacterium]
MPVTSDARQAADLIAHAQAAAGGVERESIFREMIDLLPAAIYTTDAEGRLTHFNRACVAFSGRTPELGSDQWCVTLKLFYPDGTPMSHDECPMAVALKEGRAVRGEHTIAERPDGTRIWFEPYPTPLRDAHGRIVGGINMLVDITEHKQIEAERTCLLAREREARSEAETLNEVARAVSDLDLEAVVQKATDAATELTGAKFGAFFYNVTDEKCESYVLYTLSGAPREAFEKFGLPRNTPIFAATFRGEGSVRIGDVLADPRYGKNPPHKGMPPGHLPVRSYLAVPVVASSGEVLGGLFFGHPETDVFTERSERVVQGIATHAAIAIDNARLFNDAQREIAERKRVEGALRERELQFAGIFDQTTCGIAQIDLTGRFTLVNDRYCQIVDRSREELLDLKMQDITHPDDLPGNIGKLRALVEENGPNYVIEKRYLRPDGSRVWVHNDVAAIRDEQGRVRYLAAVVTDITERKLAEDQLRRSTDELARFNRVAVGRELRMIDLKKEINALRERLGEAPRHPLQFEKETDANNA